jgi:hypothetical protein
MNDIQPEWSVCLALSNEPEVDEVIRCALEDPTEDNVVAMVRVLITEYNKSWRGTQESTG